MAFSQFSLWADADQVAAEEFQKITSHTMPPGGLDSPEQQQLASSVKYAELWFPVCTTRLWIVCQRRD